MNQKNLNDYQFYHRSNLRNIPGNSFLKMAGGSPLQSWPLGSSTNYPP